MVKTVSPVKTRGVRSRLFWTPAPVLTNQTPDPAPTPGQCLLFILLLLFDSCFYAKRLFRKGNGQIVQKTILPQRCNCSVVCNISKYLGRSRKRSIANAHALLKVRHFRDTQVVFSYKHSAEYQDLNFYFGHVKLFK